MKSLLRHRPLSMIAALILFIASPVLSAQTNNELYNF
jgi:hypothetical protein